MPKKKKKKKPGGPVGKPPLTEPRIQVFSMFGGCNFQLAPHDFDYIFNTDLEDQDGAQSDQLAMFMAIQNNARLAPNKTIETRPNLRTLFEAPADTAFTGVAALVGDRLYAACNGGAYGPIVNLVSQKSGATDHALKGWGVGVDKFTVTLAKGTRLTELLLKGRRTGAGSQLTVTIVEPDNPEFLAVSYVDVEDIPAANAEFTLPLWWELPITATKTYEVWLEGDVTLLKATDNPYAGGALDADPDHDLFFAMRGQIYYTQVVHHGVLPADNAVGNLNATVTAYDRDGSTDQDNAWSFLGHADDKLVGMSAGRQLWTGAAGSHELENARVVPDPAPFVFGNLAAKGSLTISAVASDTCPFRIGVTRTHLNKYGPTKAPAVLEFYASKPTTEWSAAAFVTVVGGVRNGYDITAVELYYTEGEAQEPAFLTRVKLPADASDTGDKVWSYNWTGYLFDSSLWSVANLKVPDANYTGGVAASMMASHDGRLYFWGGLPKHRVWIGGGPGNRFSVSTGTGGGYVDTEPGTGVEVREVLKFKTQQGAAIVTMLCDNANSQKEARFNLVETNIAISNEQSVKGWQAEKIAGTAGCKSPRGALVAGDGLYSISRYGLAITTLTMEYNSQLQIQHVSDPIEPVFLKQYGNQLGAATLFGVNDILYMTFGQADGTLDNVIFCYDIALKAWWTVTLDVDEPILNMLHIDHQDHQEGIGIVTANAVYLLPTTRETSLDTLPLHDVLIESAELCPVQPMQGMQHLTQLEFRFDHFIGELELDVTMVDQFGRTIHAQKRISHATLQHKLAEYIRIDQVVASYRISLKGKANMRLTHFMSKAYPKPTRIGSVWGFDSQQSSTSPGSIHRTFNDYNDLKAAIIP